MFFFLDIYCAAVKRDGTSKQSDIKTELLQFQMKSCAHTVASIFHQEQWNQICVTGATTLPNGVQSGFTF